MSNGYEPTPPPTTLDELQRRHATSPIIIHSQPPSDGFMGRWWRELVAICTGLAAVGVIAWVIGKQFFVTRDEWTQQQQSTAQALQSINFQLDEVKRSLQSNNVSIEKATTAIEEIQNRINEIRRPHRRSD